MTEPVSYTTRAPNTVQAMFTGLQSEYLQDVLDWLVPLLPEDTNVGQNGMGGGWIEVAPLVFEINRNQYVYIDEDGLHCVERGAFEMNYTKVV